MTPESGIQRVVNSRLLLPVSTQQETKELVQ
jgi:hypothetical protein